MGLVLQPVLMIAVNAAALYIVTQYVDGVFFTGGWEFFVVAGLILGLINAVVKPVLKILALPFIFFTAGLFSVVINGFLMWFLEYALGVLEFREVTLAFENLETYVISGIAVGLINWAAGFVIE